MTENDLRLMLKNKSTEELEELLVLNFPEPNVELIMTIMEELHERTGDTTADQAAVIEAWDQFQKSIHEYKY